MNIKTELNKAIKKLNDKKIDSAEIAAEAVLAYILKENRAFLLSHPEKKLNIWQQLRFKYSIARLLSYTPLAYILGYKEFYSLDFIVNKNVLIPRPETELMIDEALRIIKNEKLSIKDVVDIGTGSGCVVVSLAKKTKEIGRNINFYGLDVSKKALKVAKINARKNNLESCIKFLYSDLLNVIDFTKIKDSVLITANLPYLTPDQVKNSSSIKKEPKLALLAGHDGLDYYRRLFDQVKDKNGIVLLCEIDHTQKSVMENLILQTIPMAKFEIINDLGGYARLAVINIS